MIQQAIPAVLSYFAMGRWMLAAYLVCNAMVLFSSFLPMGSPATVVLVFTAVRLMYIPRETFIERRVPWSEAMIGNERTLVVIATALHMLSCAAALLAVWFVMPAARPTIPLIGGIAAGAAILPATWRWFRARKPWGAYGLW